MDLIESYRHDLRFARRPWTWWLLALFLAGLLTLPWIAPASWTVRATLIALCAIGVLGQNLLIGNAGQVSFGQAGFLAVGAYAFGHCRIAGVPFLLALLAAGLVAAAAGLALGFPSLRLKGPYLAIATLGFGVAVYQVLAASGTLSGGRAGLEVPGLTPMIGLSRAATTYYAYLALALAFTAVTYNLVSSYVGRAFAAVRDNELAAEAMGVNLARYKLLAFALSSFYTGVQGALFAQFLGHLEPQNFTVAESVTLFVAVIVGGLGFVEGSLLGAAFVTLVPVLFGAAGWLVPLAFGLGVVLVMLFEPLGLAGGWLKLRLYFEHWPFR